jgi:CDP-glycerol glycerophosphotransferase (TagB/SpsB family)
MVFSYYIKKYPYKAMWKLSRWFGKQPKISAYIAMPMDYIVLKPVLKYLPDMHYIAKNSQTLEYLKSEGIENVSKFGYPDVVIMCRHSTYRFPEEKIIKIGFRHGAYHFKAFVSADNYNTFDLYFMTSQKEVVIAKELGIVSAVSGGFPKLDPVFDGTMNDEYLHPFREKAKLEPNKKTILFCTTWDGSGMSAIEKWADRLDELTADYNIIVTLHPWVSQKYYKMIEKNPKVYLINENDVLPFLIIADVMVGDISSIIGEFCALDKPIITFKVQSGKRIVPEIIEIISNISLQINDFSELNDAIAHSLNNPNEKSPARQAANQIMFDTLDGKSGERAAQVIKEFIAKEIEVKTLRVDAVPRSG